MSKFYAFWLTCINRLWAICGSFAAWRSCYQQLRDSGCTGFGKYVGDVSLTLHDACVFRAELGFKKFSTCWNPILGTQILEHVFIAQVLKESFKLYRAINDGIINLVDKVGLVSDLVFGFTTIPFLSNVPKMHLVISNDISQTQMLFYFQSK